MFGSLRLLLALLVMLGHLVDSGQVTHFGYYAVHGFFVLSGFLMTAGLNDIYQFDARRFWINRALRLMPSYYVACLFTLSVIVLLPENAAKFTQQWTPNLLWHDAITNLILLPVHHPEPHYRLIPNAWSIAVEIQLYIALFFFVARSERLALIGVCFGLLYHGFCIYDQLHFGYRYFGAFSASLSYSMGALLYFWNKRGLIDIRPRFALLALAVWIVNLVSAGTVLAASYVYELGYYVGLALSVVMVGSFAQLRPPRMLEYLDKVLGDLSYPVFLLQWPVGFVISATLMPDTVRGWPLFWAALTPTLIAAAGLAIANDKLIEPIRFRVRQSSENSQDQMRLGGAAWSYLTVGSRSRLPQPESSKG